MDTTIKIINTNNPTIIKFELNTLISRTESFEYKNIDEAKNSPLAQKLFYFPFVKTVYITSNFIAVERYSIVEWADVQDDVANEIVNFINSGGKIVNETENSTKKIPVTVYAESTPNPSVMKFVSNKTLTTVTADFKNIDEAKASPLAIELFKFPFVKEVFLDENYISVTKYEMTTWDEIVQETRNFIKNYIENGNEIINEALFSTTSQKEKQTDKHFDSLDVTSQQIINILEEYVKPAVASDGGNIMFDSYIESEKRVKVILQGACSGCPSSTFTLKNGIENMLKDMLNDPEIKVEAINQ